MLPEDSPINAILEGYETLEQGMAAANQAGLYLPESMAQYPTLAAFTETGAYANMLLGGGTGLTTAEVGSQAWLLAEQTAEFGLEGVTATLDALGGAGMMASLMTAGFAAVGIKILGDILMSQFGPDNDYSDVQEDLAMASGKPLESTLAPMMIAGHKMLNADGSMTDIELMKVSNDFNLKVPIMWDLFNNFSNEDMREHPLGPMAVSYLRDSMERLKTDGVLPGTDAHDLKNALWITGGDAVLAEGITVLMEHAGGERFYAQMMGTDPTAGYYVGALNKAIDDWSATTYMGGMDQSVNGFWTPVLEQQDRLTDLRKEMDTQGTFSTVMDWSNWQTGGSAQQEVYTLYADDPNYTYNRYSDTYSLKEEEFDDGNSWW